MSRQSSSGMSGGGNHRGKSSSPPLFTHLVATPAPFGLLATAICLGLWMPIDMRWVEESGIALVWGYAVSFGGLWQGVAAIFDLIKGEVFGGAVFATYSAYWLGWAFMYIQTVGPADSHPFEGPEDFPATVCVWNSLYAFATLIFAVVALRTNAYLMAILITLFFCFTFLAVGAYYSVWNIVAGYFGMLCSLCCFYGALAELLLAVWHVQLPGLATLTLFGGGEEGGEEGRRIAAAAGEAGSREHEE